MQMMVPISQDFISLALLVFVFGLKHGFDADHLAAIDGLTRFNSRRRARWAKLCGLLFSLGHGTVVIAIALTMTLLASKAAAPEWLKLSGAWISIIVLSLLGVLNLYAVFSTPAEQIVSPAGVKRLLFGRLDRMGHPLGVAMIGALFALSFDTVSQAALFAASAAVFGGWPQALLLGALFTSGMLLTDGINGLWISRLIRRADETARIASRIMTLAVAGLSLLVAAFGAMKMFLPAVNAWSDGKELAFGLAVVVIIASSFWIAVRLVRTVPDRV